MNAAARLAHTSVVSRYLRMPNLLNKTPLFLLMIIISVIFSALSTIYITYNSRILHAAYQHEIAEYNHLKILSSQLLLERSTLMSPEKIRKASTEEGFITPSYQSITIIHE